MEIPVETALEMVERHLLRGEAIIEQQRMLIQRLGKAGASTVQAEHLLDVFQSIQAEHLLHLARLKTGIDSLPAALTRDGR
ncbi:hypothetical protein [Rhizobium sp. CCGE 510]|uniref:hypothetical protein n=1 Tax=Rhizobium sp. CCGE 510 TaxID=1132836 RepID=UPI00027B834F|nr:hypothetical protein [Rhizobium sp. CCGE 510]EJT06789.1 hypothetical protein RCCGE510_03308 [Rhizobium sp. CCGE 510]